MIEIERITEVGAVVIQDSYFFSAHAIINGHLTSASCMHNHRSLVLAEKCCAKQSARFDKIMMSEHAVSVVLFSRDANKPVYEVRWQEPRPVTLTWQGEGRRDVYTRFVLLCNTSEV